METGSSRHRWNYTHYYNKYNITLTLIVELEKLASRKLRLSAKKTMTIAEKLYTQGLISYPRTETNKFPPEMDLSSLVETQRADGRWGGFAGRLGMTITE